MVGCRGAGKQRGTGGLRGSPKSSIGSIFFFIKEKWKLIFRTDGPKAQTWRENLASTDLDFGLVHGCVWCLETKCESSEVVISLFQRGVDWAFSTNSLCIAPAFLRSAIHFLTPIPLPQIPPVSFFFQKMSCLQEAASLFHISQIVTSITFITAD